MLRQLVLLIAVLIIFSFIFGSEKPTAQFGEGGTIVAVCGTLPQPYPVGATRSLTQNTTGKLCQ